MKKQNQRTNHGYTIIASVALPDEEYVLGEMQKADGGLDGVGRAARDQIERMRQKARSALSDGDRHLPLLHVQ